MPSATQYLSNLYTFLGQASSSIMNLITSVTSAATNAKIAKVETKIPRLLTCPQCSRRSEYQINLHNSADLELICSECLEPFTYRRLRCEKCSTLFATTHGYTQCRRCFELSRTRLVACSLCYSSVLFRDFAGNPQPEFCWVCQKTMEVTKVTTKESYWPHLRLRVYYSPTTSKPDSYCNDPNELCAHQDGYCKNHFSDLKLDYSPTAGYCSDSNELSDHQDGYCNNPDEIGEEDTTFSLIYALLRNDRLWNPQIGDTIIDPDVLRRYQIPPIEYRNGGQNIRYILSRATIE